MADNEEIDTEQEDQENEIDDLLSDEQLDQDVKKKGFLGRIKGLKNVFSSKKAMIIAIVVFILLIAGSAGVWFFFLKGKSEAPSDLKNEISQEIPDGQTSIENQIVFEEIINLEPFERMQLQGGSNLSLLSMKISLEMVDPEMREEINSMRFQIRGVIEKQVGQMTWLELRNSDGKIKLKYALLKQINSLFGKVRIKNVYFTSFIMQ